MSRSTVVVVAAAIVAIVLYSFTSPSESSVETTEDRAAAIGTGTGELKALAGPDLDATNQRSATVADQSMSLFAAKRGNPASTRVLASTADYEVRAIATDKNQVCVTVATDKHGLVSSCADEYQVKRFGNKTLLDLTGLDPLLVVLTPTEVTALSGSEPIDGSDSVDLSEGFAVVELPDDYPVESLHFRTRAGDSVSLRLDESQ
jgi:hypothetical protein